MKKIFFLFFLLACSFVNAQNRNSVWCFGDSAGIDFGSGVPVPIYSSVNSRGSCCSIADSIGSLSFYASYDSTMLIGGTDPVKVYDKTHSIMLNGDSIKGGGWYQELTITPDPQNANLFYVFNIGVTLDWGFYYSIVDMSHNSGLGEVVQKNIQLQTFKCTDGLKATKHGNGRDWWVLFRRWDSVNDEFYKYLITPSGVSGVMIQHIGSATNNSFTKIIFNKNGDKLVLMDYPGLLEVYDFDRCTGMLSNPVTIHPEPSSSPYNFFWGADFSPDSRFLYVSTYQDTCYLYQYDLMSSNPALSRITLDTIANNFIGLGILKLAPDNKIYISSNWECLAFPICYPYPDSVYNNVNMNLGVINYPDSLGSSCGYAPFSFFLGGKRTYVALPNNPDYELGPLVGSACDTITAVSSIKTDDTSPELFVYYHSDWQKLFVNAQNLKGKNCLLQIFDVNGKEVYSSQKKTNPPYFTQDVPLEGIANGMYIVSLTTEKETMTKKFVRE